jgi:hypothetical protein
MEFRQYLGRVNEEVKKYYSENYSRNAKQVSVNRVLDIYLVFDDCSFTVRRKNVTVKIDDIVIQILTSSTFKSIEYSIEIARLYSTSAKCKTVELEKYAFASHINVTHDKLHFSLRSKLNKQLCFRVNKKIINIELLNYILSTFLS